MIDRKLTRVKKGLQCCMAMECPDRCPYSEGCSTPDGFYKRLHQEALDVIRDMEARMPLPPAAPAIEEEQEFDGQVVRLYRCGACGAPIDMGDAYCRACGQAAKWD